MAELKFIVELWFVRNRRSDTLEQLPDLMAGMLWFVRNRRSDTLFVVITRPTPELWFVRNRRSDTLPYRSLNGM